MSLLQAKLGLPWRFVSAGDIMRQAAKRHSITIEHLAKLCREDPAQMPEDERCDRMIEDFGRQNYVVAEGRLVHVFVPSAFHVLLTCPLEVRAERRHTDSRDTGLDLEEVTRLIRVRDEDDRARYEKMYPGCLWPSESFNLVIDTRECAPEQVVRAIEIGHTGWVHDNADAIAHSVHLHR